MTDASTQTLILEPEAPSLGRKNDKDIKKISRKKKKTELPRTLSAVLEQPATITDESCEDTIEQLQRLIKSAKCRENSIDNALIASEPKTTLNSDKHVPPLADNLADSEQKPSNSTVERLKQLISAARNNENSKKKEVSLNTDLQVQQNRATQNAEDSSNIKSITNRMENTDREQEIGDTESNAGTQRSVPVYHK